MDHKCCPGCEEPVVDKLPGCPLQCRTVQCMAYKQKPVYDYKTMPIVWIIGGPGSGRGVVCQNIAATCQFTVISVGAMLRAEVEEGTDRSNCLKSVMSRGGFPPNDLVLELIIKAIEKNAAKGTAGFIVDGFPREKAQGPLFERALGPASLIVYLEATTDQLFQGMKTRAKNPERLDETPQAIRLRLETFMNYNESVIELYKYRLVKITALDSPQATSAEVMKLMTQLMDNVAALKIQKEKANLAQLIPGTTTGSNIGSKPGSKPGSIHGSIPGSRTGSRPGSGNIKTLQQ